MRVAGTKCQRFFMKKSSPRDPREFESPKCVTVGSDLFFGKDPDEPGYVKSQVDYQHSLAKKICGGCIHRVECAEWAILNEIHGVWGGLTPQERKKIRRRQYIKLKDTVLT